MPSLGRHDDFKNDKIGPQYQRYDLIVRHSTDLFYLGTGILAACGKLRDDATGVCLKSKALCDSSDRKGQYKCVA